MIKILDHIYYFLIFFNASLNKLMRVLHSGFKPYMVCITSLWFDKIICNLMKYWLLKYSFVIWKMWKAEWTKFLNKIIEHTHDHYNWNCTWTDKNRIALSWGLILTSYVAAESCQLSSEILGQPTWMEVWVGRGAVEHWESSVYWWMRGWMNTWTFVDELIITGRSSFAEEQTCWRFGFAQPEMFPKCERRENGGL